jgi:hypothetical protein
MLKDVKKFSHHHCCVKGEKKTWQRYEKGDYEDAPTHAKSFPQGHWKEGRGISTKALRRYLDGCIGKLWEEVFAKIPDELRGDLKWLIEDEMQEINGKFIPLRGFSDGYFIKEGVFLKGESYDWNKKYRPKKKNKYVRKDVKFTKSGRVETVYLDLDKKTYILRNGFWFEIVQGPMRDVYRWNKHGQVEIVTEPSIIHRQVDGKLQKKLSNLAA